MWPFSNPQKQARGGETQPLLPQHVDENTELQRQLREKLYTYEVLRALYNGFMPTTDQAVAHLRALLVSDFLNPANPTLSQAGRQLSRDCRVWIRTLIDLLCDKNGGNQIQEIIWNFSKSRISVDTGDLAGRASLSKAQADTAAAFESLRTIGSLLMTNSDFRLLVGDLATVARHIYSQSASSVSAAAERVAEKVEPSEPQKQPTGQEEPNGEQEEAPSTADLRQETGRIAEVTKKELGKGVSDVAKDAEETMTEDQKQSLVKRVKQTVENLRNKENYTDSAATVSQIAQRYASIYYRAMCAPVDAAQEDVEANDELKSAIEKCWEFLSSFGDRMEWQRLQEKCHKLLDEYRENPEFKDSIGNLGNSLYSMLTDPEFYDSADNAVDRLKEKLKEAEPIPREDMDAFLRQLKQTFQSVSNDEGIARLTTATKKLGDDLITSYHDKNTRLPADALHIFLPLFIRSIQYIPIPRLEVSVPEMDLLLENVIIEPGHTVHCSSFLPYRVLLSTQNSLELRKTHSKETTTSMVNIVTVTMNGLSVSANEFGYWARVHALPYMPTVGDQGIASFALDQRGIDISLDFEIGREHLEQILVLRAVRVEIHKLDYTISDSRWKFLWWIVKPFLKHMVRRVLEKKIAEQIVATAHALNRELVFARERLRAARIADPESLVNFVKAILSRLSPKPDPDLYTRVGVDAPHGEGIFKDVYTPASLMKIWHEEGETADDTITAGDESGGVGRTWKNSIFDIRPSRRASR